MPPHPKPGPKPKSPRAMKSKPKAATGRPIQAAEKPKEKAAKAPKPAKLVDGTSKTALLMGMLTKPGGASSAEMETATGWKPHSVRGFLGTLRKRGVVIAAKKFGKGEPTVYSIESAQAAPAEPFIGNPPAEDPGEVV